MRFVSTRNPATTAGFSAALAAGLAPDGGLYVPESWPQATLSAARPEQSLAEVAAELVRPFAADDALAAEVPAICREAFDFPAPVTEVQGAGGLSVLELFHGPTAAFKDFGARFLAGSLTRLRRGAARPLTILVATSGDTGGAVAAAFHRQPGTEVVVLFPKGLVSPTQEQQLTCWGDNVRSFSVLGTFDDCQALVKQAFLDTSLRAGRDLSSANSINLGRLLPQASYYVSASVAVRARTGRPASFIIPSGNLGNATACVWARLLGAPIGRIVLAHNANRTVPDYLVEGAYRPRASVATLASAMDVGNPSNFERLAALYPDVARMRAAVTALSVDDEAIRARIRNDFRKYGRIWCPHTAVAAEAFARLPEAERAAHAWVIVATAHPAKFREAIEPLIGESVALPASLAALFQRPSRSESLAANLPALQTALGARSAA